MIKLIIWIHKIMLTFNKSVHKIQAHSWMISMSVRRSQYMAHICKGCWWLLKAISELGTAASFTTQFSTHKQSLKQTRARPSEGKDSALSQEPCARQLCNLRCHPSTLGTFCYVSTSKICAPSPESIYQNLCRRTVRFHSPQMFFHYFSHALYICLALETFAVLLHSLHMIFFPPLYVSS